MLPDNASKASTSIRAFFAFLESALLSKQKKGSPHRVDRCINYLHGHIATYFFMCTRLGSLEEIVKKTSKAKTGVNNITLVINYI